MIAIEPTVVNLARGFGDAVRTSDGYWLFYHQVDDIHVYQEGPFDTFSEARRVAHEVDLALFPMEIWIECANQPVWKVNRKRRQI